jgi:hypothetical protein
MDDLIECISPDTVGCSPRTTRRDRPAGRGCGARHAAAERAVPKHVSMSWAQRLKHVFGIEIETCRRCVRAAKGRANGKAPKNGCCAH